MPTITPEQQAKLQESRRSAVVENGVRARIARRTLRAEDAIDAASDARTAAADAFTKAKAHEASALALWDGADEAEIEGLVALTVTQYVAVTKNWADSGEDTWLRHAEMAANPTVYMLTQDGTVKVGGEDTHLDPDNPDAVAAFVSLHQEQAAIWRAALDAAETELDVLVPIIEDDGQDDGDLVTADDGLDFI